jgi:hypothetical protein
MVKRDKNKKKIGGHLKKIILKKRQTDQLD